ncbi:MAG: DUF4212 domain-containing protein [Planctomycetes bacterium]|nr:DUF4212 domain-containing protein [Planctomycetota bacterium]
MNSHPPSRETRYWLRNVRLVSVLLSVWFAVSYGAAILLVPWLNGTRIPGTGFRLGFWMAQQGSILAFVALIFVYARRMDRIEREEGLDERDQRDEENAP